MAYYLRYFLVLLTLTAMGCPSPATLPVLSEGEAAPRNVILLIGDGMGIAQITASMYHQGKPLSIERFPVTGIQQVHSADNLVTDSAAGATAFATGSKTNNSALGLNERLESVPTILEMAEQRGLATGLVTTAPIVHATPAAFFAHVPLRGQYEDIAVQLTQSGVDFFVGGGMKYFSQRSQDQNDLIEIMQRSGYLISSVYEQPFATLQPNFNQKFGYFTAMENPPAFSAGRDYLPFASRTATRFLERASDKGFFLMIEGAQIDWGGHKQDFDYLLSELNDFDLAVREVLKFAVKNKETLVIVTGDHETGGLAIQPGSTQDSLIAAFATDYHTATMIPVFAFGPGAGYFRGMYDNTDIFHRMVRALGWQ